MSVMTLTDKEILIEKLLKEIDIETYTGLRNKVLIRMLFEVELSAKDTLKLKWKDIEKDVCVGKYVLSESLVKLLHDWSHKHRNMLIDLRQNMWPATKVGVSSPEDEYIFITRKYKPVSSSYLSHTITKYASLANVDITPKDISSYSLYKRFNTFEELKEYVDSDDCNPLVVKNILLRYKIDTKYIKLVSYICNRHECFNSTIVDRIKDKLGKKITTKLLHRYSELPYDMGYMYFRMFDLGLW